MRRRLWPEAMTGMGVALAALLLLSGGGMEADAEALELTIKPLKLDANRPDQTRLGELVWRGGIALEAEHESFGGLSSLLVSDDGTRLLATTDRGWWFSADIEYDGGQLSGLRQAHLTPMRGTNGQALAKRRARDAESLARGEDGALLVGFEVGDRILRYEAAGAFDAERLGALTPSALPRPPGFDHLKGNKGIEALVELGDGRALAIAEGEDNRDLTRPAWLIDRAGEAETLAYHRAYRFRPTGAARLPNGDLLVLERRYTLLGGVSALIRRVADGDVRPGALLDGEILVRFIPPITVDNMEGIAAREGENGETLIYLVSDDNFSPLLQRTLLLMFELAPDTGG